MKDEDKTKEQLINELVETRQRITELKVSETERKRAEEALEQRAAQLALINDIGEKIAAVLELDSVLDMTARVVQKTFSYHHVALFTVDRERCELVMRAKAGSYVHLFPPDHRLKLGQGMVGWVSRHGERLLANDVAAEPRYVNLHPDVIPTRSELSVPIRVGEEIVGALDVQSPQLNAFDENDVMVMETLADQIAVAIENARLYDAVQRELTERKRAEEVLRKYHNQLEELVEERTAELMTANEQLQREITERKRAEEVLRIKDSAIASSINAIAIADLKGNLTYVNNSFLKMWGCDDDKEVLGKPAVIFWQTKDKAMEVVEVLRDTGSWIGELIAMRKDGSLFDAQLSASMVTDEAGKPICMMSSFIDITERKKAEEALRGSEGKYRFLADNATDIIYTIDMNQCFTYVSPSVEKVLGYTAEEALSMKARDVLTPQSYKYQLDELENQLEKSGEDLATISRVMELELLRKDGTIILGEIHASLILGDNGQPVGILGVCRDITERKKAEEKIKQAAEEWKTTFDSITDLVSIHSKDLKLVRVNRAYADIFKVKAEELIGKTCYEVIHGTKEPPQFCPHKQALETKKPATAEFFDPRLGIHLEVSVSPIVNEKRELTGTVHIVKDVTERKRLEEELLKIQKLESLGILAGGIAHDFNNILTAILGNITLAKMSLNPEDEIFEILTKAEEASLRTKSLTQQLLTFSKGGAPIKKIVCIAELIKNSADFALRGSNVRCEFSIPDNLWTAEVDEGQMGQVINNLIINAEQAMPEGGVIKVSAENMRISAKHNHLPISKGKYIKVSIEDQGIGIREEHLPKIFDPYFTTKQKGSGLGLATAYSIIKNHDGYITVESKLGIGTTFCIYLPASKKKIVTEKYVGERPLVGKGRILVMDDEEIVRDVAGSILKHIGYGVEFAEDGAEAIELYKKAKESGKPFDAVIIDLTVPGGMGGKEAVERLLEIDPEVKAIASSGYSNDPLMADFKKYGFSGVVAKPYKVEDLSKILHKVTMGMSESPV